MTTISLRAYNKEIDGLIDNGQKKEAIAHCRYILTQFPKHIETYRLLGKAYLESQRYTEASDVLQRVLSCLPDDFVSQVGMSMIREDEGNLDAAIFHMERAFEAQPSSTAVQGELRRLYGRRDGVAPTRIRLTRGSLVRMYARGDLYQQAISEANLALFEQPDRVDLQVILARMYLLYGQKISAMDVASKLVEVLPYCYEANRILAELLPGTSRGEDAKVYQQRLIALDPYLAHIPAGGVTADDAPDDSVTLNIFEGEIEAESENQPSWAQTVGVQMDDQGKELLPDWLTSMEPEQAVNEAAGVEENTPKGTDWENLPIQATPEGEKSADEPTPADQEIPDWMAAAGWQPSRGEPIEEPVADETLAQAADDLAASEGEIPDWLQAIAPVDDTGQSVDETKEPPSEEDNTWLESILADADQKTGTLSGLELAAPEEPVQQMEQVSTTDEGAPGIAEIFPTVPEIPAVEESAAPLPDWLTEITAAGEPAPQPIEAAGEEDWLNLLHPREGITPEEPETAAEVVPAEGEGGMGLTQPAEEGLVGFEIPDISAPPFAAEEVTEPFVEETPAFSEELRPESSPIEGGAVSELASEEAPASSADQQPETTAFEEEEVIQPVSEQEPAAGEEPIKETTLFTGEASSEPISGAASVPVVAEEGAEPISEEAPVRSEEIVLQSTPSSEDFFKMSEEAAPSSTDATQPTQVHTDEFQNAPFAPIFTGEESSLEPEPPAAPGEAVEPSIEEAGQTPVLPMADEEDLSIFDLNLPEEILPEEIDLASLEALKPEDVEVPDWLKDSLEPSAGEPATEIPASELDWVDQEVDSGLTEAYNPEMDDEAAFAWLESLAARQGAGEETLQTLPEERPEETPEWIASAADARVTETEIPAEEFASASEELVLEEPAAVEPEVNLEDEAVVEEVPAEKSEPEFATWLTEATIVPAELTEKEAIADSQGELPEWLLETLGGEEESEIVSEEEPAAPPPLIYRAEGEWVPEEELPVETGVEVPVEPEQMETAVEEPLPATEPAPIEEPPAAVVEPGIEEEPVTPEFAGEESPVEIESEAVQAPAEVEPAVEEIPTPPEPAPVGDTEPEEVPDWLQGLAEETPLAAQPTAADVEAPPEWLKELEGEESGLMPEVPAYSSSTGKTGWLTPAEPAAVEASTGDTSPVRVTPQAVLAPSDGGDLYNAQAALSVQNIDGALEYYNRLISRGEALEDVIHDLRDALYRYPVDVSIWQTLGDAYARSNQLQEALDAYTKAEELLR